MIIEVETEDEVELKRSLRFLLDRVQMATEAMRAEHNTVVSLSKENGELITRIYMTGRPRPKQSEVQDLPKDVL